MQKPNDYDNTQAQGEYIPVELGGHKLVIKQVTETTSKTGKPMIVVCFDFAPDDVQPGYFMEQFKNDIRPDKKWPNQATQYILTEDADGNCSRSFKTFTTCVEHSNTGFTTKWGDNFGAQFKGKKIGGVFGEQMDYYNGREMTKRVMRWFVSLDKVATAVIPEKNETQAYKNHMSGYRKSVSLEAIAERGYDAAVQSTDEEFKSDLTNVVSDRFYAQLKAGSLVGHESTWQMAFAMAIGKVVNKFQEMKRTATGVAVWVNTLDVYKYLGAADITVQTAFGFKYMKNFMGADVVFMTSQIPEGVVIATPLNNMVAYYVDPGDSEFVKAGLQYTTDPTTGFIGFHVQGTYERAISDMFAIMGLRLFCEYLDAIAYISVGDSDTQTLGTLNVTSAAGSETGKTKLTVKEQIMSPKNCWKYKDAAAATSVTYGMDVKGWSKWDGESEIVSTAAHHITLQLDGPV